MGRCDDRDIVHERSHGDGIASRFIRDLFVIRKSSEVSGGNMSSPSMIDQAVAPLWLYAYKSFEDRTFVTV